MVVRNPMERSIIFMRNLGIAGLAFFFLLAVAVVMLLFAVAKAHGQPPLPEPPKPQEIVSEIKAAQESEKLLHATVHARYEVAIARDLCVKYKLPLDRLEYRLEDGTRVDILADDCAYEVDWATNGKWAEAIGQSLYYGIVTKRKPGIILLVEDVDRDAKYVNRCATVCGQLGIRLKIEVLTEAGKVR